MPVIPDQVVGQLGELPEVVSGDLPVLGEEDERHGRHLTVSLTLLALQVEPVLLDLGELERLRGTAAPLALESGTSK